MFELHYALDFINQINANCEKVLELKEKLDSSFAKEKKISEKEVKKLVSELKRSLESYIENNISPLSKRFDDIIASLSEDANCLLIENTEELEAVDLRDDVIAVLSVEEATKELNEVVNELNEKLASLNAANFDELVPPVRIMKDGDSFYTYTDETGKLAEYTFKSELSSELPQKPLAEAIEYIIKLCEKGKVCVRRLEQAYEAMLGVKEYEAYVQNTFAEWKETTASENEVRCASEFFKLFDSSEAKAKHDSFFDDMKIAERGASVNPEIGTLTDSEEILLGHANIKVTSNPANELLISQSTSLSKYLNDAHINAPVILDLKKCGNVILHLKEEDTYARIDKEFINQTILKFLLAFPPNKIKFRLIDIANKADFSSLISLTKINTDILLNGIIRDSRKLEDSIRDMEQLMYTVDESKLSYNNVSNIFEYNKSFETNPQCFHLFVLTDFPNGISEDLAQRVFNIMQHGNKAGIFTLLVCNYAAHPAHNWDEGEVVKTIEKMKEYALNVLDSRGIELKVDCDSFGLPLAINKELSIERLPQIIEMLQANAESTKQKNVLIDTMFGETDASSKSSKGILPAAEVLDIPIGVRGGEVQTLKLETNGGVSPHAVVIGGTGSGKSNLLHTIILSTCYRYSPEEVNLYLIDFKGGNEFKFYEANGIKENQIPHIKLTGLTSDVEDGIAILNNLQNVLADRQEKFRKANVSDIVQYCQAGHKMPRLFVIVDEIQELFERDDKLGQKAIDILRELFKLGRAYGITILWASQNIPNAPGLRDKVISQIGNRISLKLNEPDDAMDIHIDPKMVRALNRPEKGLGIIKDSRTGNDCVEFRVAYAENIANRQKYASQIIDKWQGVVVSDNNESLYIVGQDVSPSPIAGNSVFATSPFVMSKAFAAYNVQFGVNYITGKPFNIELKLRENKSNLVFFGSNIEVICDMMGYALMSIVMEQITNSDCKKDTATVYYANGDTIRPQDTMDLFNVVRKDFSDYIKNVSSSKFFKESVKDLYKLYKERQEESESLNEPKIYEPHVFVIHSLQSYIDLFETNPMLSLNEDNMVEQTNIGAGGANSIFGLQGVSFESSSIPNSRNSVSFVNAFKELLSRAGQFGIHFVISQDNPDAISNIRNELYAFNYKVLTKGINATVISQVLGSYGSATINNPEVALVAINDEKHKVHMYRYDHDVDSKWYNELAEKYRQSRS